MINILTENKTPRVDYAFRLVFETILKVPVAFYQIKEYFLMADGVKINYTPQHVEGILAIHPHSLLFEDDVRVLEPGISEWDSLPVFFEIENSIIPFDVFAASFFLASRYEEYLPGSRDEHGRFKAEGSFAAKNNFLGVPLINKWVLKLAGLIKSEYPEFEYSKPEFRYVPTIDIDNAFAYRFKGVIRNFLSGTRNLMNSRFSEEKNRLKVLFRIEHDPYDSYDFLFHLFEKYKLQPVFFFLLNKKGGHDRSLSWRNPFLRRLIRRVAKKADVGIHPSYETNTSPDKLSIEIVRLQSILKRRITKSRQHFLMLKLPDTYRELLKNNIKADYSMGYAYKSGFRASIATPFPFFDLIQNQTTKLTVYPFVVMDVSLNQYCKFTPSEALQKIEKLMQETFECGGTFMSLWHNESLHDTGTWQGWRDVYLKMTEKAVKYRNGN
ncbi:MAG: polysaccharide deacetylase family protein [Prolixibacteraceae bacterium]|nr:polysaccharide deacetylase family protein [Prolixibacteraceae bacterium]